jgi:hypothetical protein
VKMSHSAVRSSTDHFLDQLPDMIAVLLRDLKAPGVAEQARRSVARASGVVRESCKVASREDSGFGCKMRCDVRGDMRAELEFKLVKRGIEESLSR